MPINLLIYYLFFFLSIIFLKSFEKYIHNRIRKIVYKTLAMMVKTLPITLNINSDLTIKEFFEYTNKEWFDVLTHSSYPLTEISNKYGFMPEFLYAFHGNIVEDIKINGNYVKREALDEDVLKFKLNLGISEIDGDVIRFYIKFNCINCFITCTYNYSNSCKIKIRKTSYIQTRKTWTK